MIRKALFFILGYIILANLVQAQDLGKPVPEYNVPITRQLVHDNIKAEQQRILASDGKSDGIFHIENHPDADALVTDALIRQVDWLRYNIETDAKIDNRLKAGYLLGIVDILQYIRVGWQKKMVNPTRIPQIIALYKKLINVNQNGESLLPYVASFPYDVAYTASLPRVFEENNSYAAVKDMLVLKYIKQNPTKAFYTLTSNTNAPYTDSVIRAAGRQYPEQLYSYAQANNKLGYKIRNIKDDDFVQTIVELSQQKSGQIYFPFLDNLVNKKLSIKEVDAAKNNSLAYYRLLVKTQIDYAGRAMNGDTAVGFRELTLRLTKKAEDDFVAVINGLHESPDAVRFSVLQPLTPEELYYVAVLTDGLIYTSSYTNGVYPLMMKKANNRGDSLLLNLKFDHYRKFISQAASYNTLQKFFSSFSNKEDTRNLMTTFVSGLEKSKGLEDGVDVADSYASIYETMPELSVQMLTNVKRNLDANFKKHNERGVAIYSILYDLFMSADSTNAIDLTKELGIPPVYKVPFNSLTNGKGGIITQMFFYGDDDGKLDFGLFKNTYNALPNWTVDDSSPYWIVAKTTKGVPISIYANRPLPNETDEDYKAQTAVSTFFEKNSIYPTITFHRGHSYHATTTIGYMAPTSKIVFMGSCGGFSLIDSILRKSSDAHIISSKQIGKRDINLPFILLITEKLRNGQDIDWIPFWKEFRTKANITGLEDYIPPYKNLGALFIKAYKQKTGEEGI